MHRSEERQLATCADCGARFDAVSDRGFGIDAESALCWTCALRRGGTWDEEREQWSTEPGVADLESRPR